MRALKQSSSGRARSIVLSAATVAVCLWLLLASKAQAAIIYGQLDDSQDGTVAGWAEGPVSPNPPTNVANGGPAGIDDRFLQNVSGGSQAGSRMVMFNKEQWTGDYKASGITALTLDLANFGDSSLSMRIMVESSDPSGVSRFGSTTAAVLPPDGLWHPVVFELSPTALSRLFGTRTLAQVLQNVTELRILSSAAGPDRLGEIIQGTLGMDNLRAVPEPSFVWMAAVGALLFCCSRPRPRAFGFTSP